jgi:transposase
VPPGQLDLNHLEKLAAAGEPGTVPASLLLSLIVKIEVPEAEVSALKAKLSKDSHNSSKPPSTDKSNPGGSPPRKLPQGAGKGGRKKPGGQAGRKGSNLGKSMEPDRIVELARPEKCGCGQG